MSSPSFGKTKRKIALMLAVVAGVLMLGTTALVMFVVTMQMRQQAKNVLSESLENLSIDLQTNNLEEKTLAINFQSYNPRAVKSPTADFAAEVDMAESTTEKEESKNINNGSLIIDEAGFEKLKENKQVYSRVLVSNGDTLFSSDIFDTFAIDSTVSGFKQYDIRGICIYAHTAKINSGEYAGSTIQVAQYCPVSSQQQRVIFISMLFATFISSLIAYGIGYFFAGKFLQPLQESAGQTRAFAQNVYHELFTPVSVAITTVAASLRSKKYKSGLESVNEDLTEIQKALSILSKNAFETQASISKSKINISEIVLDLSADMDCEFNTQSVEAGIKKKANETSIRLAIQNILNNACKYGSKKNVIIISLTERKLSVQNKVEYSDDIDITQFFSRYYRGKNAQDSEGKGLGLALVKDLAGTQGWKVDALLFQDTVSIEIHF